MKKRLPLILSLVFAIAIIGGALAYASVSSKPAPQRPVSKAELAKHDGLDGRICWVAVDNTVYEIKGFALWEYGQHTPTNGRVKCGRDVTVFMDQSPHGRSKLKLLRKIGPLT